MLDNDSTTYYHSGNAQRAGHWAGLDLGAVRKVEEINIPRVATRLTTWIISTT